MNSSITLGSSPGDEPCAQVGQEGYSEQARHECGVYRRQMERILAELDLPREKWPVGFALKIKGSGHDFGTYYELHAVYDQDDEAACKLSFLCEESIPSEWDEEAKRELASFI